jgi:beta-lactamase regulating signal transducer with metallopeptidase domain
VRVEIMRKFITIVWPLIGFIATLAFLAVFHRPLCRIPEQLNCGDVESIKIRVEIVKQRRPKHTRTLRQKKNQGCATRGCSNR